MEIRLTANEIAIIKKLANLYASGVTSWRLENDHDALGLTAENYAPMMGIMERYGAIEGVQHTAAQRFSTFRISPMIIQLSRQIAEKEQEAPKLKNNVEEIKAFMQSKPIIAWLVIGSGVILILLNAANGTVTLLQNLGFMAKP